MIELPRAGHERPGMFIFRTAADQCAVVQKPLQALPGFTV
jgi:hypothetical protein